MGWELVKKGVLSLLSFIIARVADAKECEDEEMRSYIISYFYYSTEKTFIFMDGPMEQDKFQDNKLLLYK